MTFLCKYCQSKWLYWSRLPSGRMIPVDDKGNPHLDDCPRHPNTRAKAVSRNEIKKIDDWDLTEEGN